MQITYRISMTLRIWWLEEHEKCKTLEERLRDLMSWWFSNIWRFEELETMKNCEDLMTWRIWRWWLDEFEEFQELDDLKIGLDNLNILTRFDDSDNLTLITWSILTYAIVPSCSIWRIFVCIPLLGMSYL